MSDLPPPPTPEPQGGGGQPQDQDQVQDWVSGSGRPPIYEPPSGYGQPPPGSEPPPPPPPFDPGYGYGPNPAYGYRPFGMVPRNLGEIYYNPALNILLYVCTCGIWGGIWAWRTHDDLEKYNGDGIGGAVGLVLGLLIQVAVMFTIPNEIEKMYQREGRQSPVTTLWGLWFLLPIVGHFVWYLQVQGALNDFWISKGARHI